MSLGGSWFPSPESLPCIPRCLVLGPEEWRRAGDSEHRVSRSASQPLKVEVEVQVEVGWSGNRSWPARTTPQVTRVGWQGSMLRRVYRSCWARVGRFGSWLSPHATTPQFMKLKILCGHQQPAPLASRAFHARHRPAKDRRSRSRQKMPQKNAPEKCPRWASKPVVPDPEQPPKEKDMQLVNLVIVGLWAAGAAAFQRAPMRINRLRAVSDLSQGPLPSLLANLESPQPMATGPRMDEPAPEVDPRRRDPGESKLYSELQARKGPALPDESASRARQTLSGPCECPSWMSETARWMSSRDC